MSKNIIAAAALAALVPVALSQPSCEYSGVNYGDLINYAGDYAQASDFYQNYEFVFNICKQLTWVNGDCVSGSGVCERLSGAQTATDVYGIYSNGGTTVANWNTDSSGQYIPSNNQAHYILMNGAACMFGGTMESRIYHTCDANAAQPTVAMLHESYYDCQVFVNVNSKAACAGGGGGGGGGGSPGGSTGRLSPDDEADVGMWLCIFFFLGTGMFFGIGGYMNHSKGEQGWDRVPARAFFSTIPGLVKDGIAFSHVFVKSKLGKSDELTELK